MGWMKAWAQMSKSKLKVGRKKENIFEAEEIAMISGEDQWSAKRPMGMNSSGELVQVIRLDIVLMSHQREAQS